MLSPLIFWVLFTLVTCRSYLACIKAFHLALSLAWSRHLRQLWGYFPCLKIEHSRFRSHRCRSHSFCGLFPLVSMMSLRLLERSAVGVFLGLLGAHHWIHLRWCSSWGEWGLWTGDNRSPSLHRESRRSSWISSLHHFMWSRPNNRLCRWRWASRGTGWPWLHWRWSWWWPRRWGLYRGRRYRRPRWDEGWVYLYTTLLQRSVNNNAWFLPSRYRPWRACRWVFIP